MQYTYTHCRAPPVDLLNGLQCRFRGVELALGHGGYERGIRTSRYGDLRRDQAKFRTQFCGLPAHWPRLGALLTVPAKEALLATPLDPFHLFQKHTGICTQESADLEKLDDVDAAIPVLDLGDEGLRSTQFVRELLLRHVRFEACLNEGSE